MPYKDKEVARQKQREYEKRDRSVNPEKYKIRAREKYLKNREKRLAYVREYRKLYPEKVRLSNKKSREKHREKRLIYRKLYRETVGQWYWDKQLEGQKRRRDRMRRIVIEHYGNECSCCKENEYGFLTIDHVNGGGTKHRKTVTATSLPFFIVKNNFPKDYQVLCYNCNCSKAFTKEKLCPHKIIKVRSIHSPI